MQLRISWRKNIMIKRNCPICDSTRAEIKIESNNDAQSLSWENLKDSFIGLRADQVFFKYSRCSDCKLIYNQNYFSHSELADLYKHMPPNLVGDEIKVVEKTHSGYVKHIKRYVTKADSLIEIGADLGLVTSGIVSKFGIKRGVLIEPNRDVRDALFDSVNRNSNFEIVDYLEDVKEDDRFDLCIAVHVIDHLINPLDDLRRIRKSMSENGAIFIVVHDQTSLLARLMGKNWPPYCLQHPQIYDSNSIHQLLLQAGFNSVKVSKSTNWLGLRHSIITLASLFHLPTRFLRLIPNIAIPVKLGNLIVRGYVKENI